MKEYGETDLRANKAPGYLVLNGIWRNGGQWKRSSAHEDSKDGDGSKGETRRVENNAMIGLQLKISNTGQF